MTEKATPRIEWNDKKFLRAVRAMEKRTKAVSAYVIINPAEPDQAGRVVFSYPKDGMGRLNVIAWLPRNPADPESGSFRWHGSASDCGYDKSSAAMEGAPFWNIKTGAVSAIPDQGRGWRRELEDAGYTIILAA